MAIVVEEQKGCSVHGREGLPEKGVPSPTLPKKKYSSGRAGGIGENRHFIHNAIASSATNTKRGERKIKETRNLDEMMRSQAKSRDFGALTALTGSEKQDGGGDLVS